MTLAAEQDAAVRAIVASMLKQALGGADARIRDRFAANIADPSPSAIRLQCLRIAAESYPRGDIVAIADVLTLYVSTGFRTGDQSPQACRGTEQAPAQPQPVSGLDA